MTGARECESVAEVGIVCSREDRQGSWKQQKLGALLSLEYGASLPEETRTPGDCPVYGSNGRVGWHSEKLVDGPGIVVGRKGSVGEVTWVDTDFWPIDTTYFVKPKTDKSLRWLYYLLKSRDIRRLNAATGVPGLNRNDAHALKVGVPPNGETHRIAEILFSVDTAIERTRAVIEQVRVVKQALLAKLMTNGLPGRRCRLTSVRLGEVFAERKEPGRSGLPVVSVTIDNGLVRRGSLDRRVDSDLRPEQHLLARKGDIAYNMMRMWQGVSGIAEEDCLISPAYVVCRPLDGIVPEFAAYFLKHPQTVRLLHRHSQGVADDRLRLYFHHLASIRVKLPPLPIQRDVARMLASVDKRIAASVEHLKQLDKGKRGLLEQLLTGRIRVVKENRK
ncbi:MAG: restriction endonuclease subunit S [Planctomycetota bacterium]